MESDFGITEYIGLDGSTESLQPIQCILKELYSDFIVQEILADKTVLPLPNSKEEKDAKNDDQKEVKEEETKEKEIPRPSFLSEEGQKIIDEVFEKKIKEETSVEIGELTKDQRREIHEFIREKYREQLNSETKGTAIGVQFVGNSNKGRKRKRWEGPDYCHFTMAKENKDTSYALGIVGQMLSNPRMEFRTHGIKDRRGVTVQRCSAFRVEKDRLLAANSRLRDIRVYDCSYENEHVKMGGHWGNRFNIVLRDVGKENREILEERMRIFAQNGFINYYGTQRFGSLSISTSDVGKLILQRKWEEAVRAMLCENSPDKNAKGQSSIAEATAKWRETGDAKEALKLMKGGTASASLEGIVLRALTKGSTYQQCMTEALNINSRSLYVHAYQSLIWNKVASRRVHDFGIKVVAGDRGENGEELKEDTAHINQIAIPLPGVSKLFDGSTVQEWIDDYLTADGLDRSTFEAMKRHFALGEQSRPLFVVPEDVEWKFVEYDNPREPIQDGLSSRAAAKSGNLLALQLSFNLSSGCYATVALRQITGSDMGKKAQKGLSLAGLAGSAGLKYTEYTARGVQKVPKEPEPETESEKRDANGDQPIREE
ncbi:hypothetical protein WR25_13025 [Diploscapter pachys]|uniref:TRUD domain-containing protein n=1 Tax=Diploscapter pachys TaxID=2018661 RepID=A0A2A2JU66_9BILA|nr:hypothetical protein WR25_13025 [Diploscapter pachys]